jgi:uncharacterized tannase-like protein DUF6351
MRLPWGQHAIRHWISRHRYHAAGQLSSTKNLSIESQICRAFHRRRIALIGGVLGGLTVLALFGCTAARDKHRDKPRATLRVLSTQAHLISGGDALIEVDVTSNASLDQVQVMLNGEDVTAVFHPVSASLASTDSILRGLVSDLDLGDHVLAVSILDADQQPIRNAGDTLTLTNWPISGPLISGPHEVPFACQTESFLIGPDVGRLGTPVDDDCSVSTRVDFVYRSTDGQFKILSTSNERPDDLQETKTTTGKRVPYIVRLETGTINRAIYQTAVLATSPDAAPDPWRTAPGWNGRLIYKFGGGCRRGWYRQGKSMEQVLDHMMLSQGFATASASLNVAGNNCNTLLAAETMMMVKERFIERNGLPEYTIGWGCSGGSYQLHFIADNYPGLLDGIIPQCSFPDVAFATAYTISDTWLLENYFTNRASVHWTRDEQLAVTGFANLGHLVVLSQAAARIDPVPNRANRPSAEFNSVVPSSMRYHPVGNPTGARATIYDHTVAVYSRQDDTGFAQRPLDNVGVQYGLQALNAGEISKEQFLDLNERIGGFDIDANMIDQRTVADLEAVHQAYESGQLLSGGGGLASMPILDIDAIYSDLDAGGELHMKFHHFSTRERLQHASGRSDNHVMWSGAGRGTLDVNERGRLNHILRQGLALMDAWLNRIQADASDADVADKVVQNKPEALSDGCWTRGADPEFIKEQQKFGGRGSSSCNDLYPSFSSPRMVAGGPLSNDIAKCQLKRIDFDDYAVKFNSDQRRQLRRIFPDGVCDWEQPGVEQRPPRGLWLSFGPSPVNRVDEGD